MPGRVDLGNDVDPALWIGLEGKSRARRAGMTEERTHGRGVGDDVFHVAGAVDLARGVGTFLGEHGVARDHQTASDKACVSQSATNTQR